MFEFNSAFKSGYRIYLDGISYQSVPEPMEQIQVSVTATDDVDFTLKGTSVVRMTVKRQLTFNPDVAYRLYVAYVAEFDILDGAALEPDWEKQLRASAECRKVLRNVMGRISLLISQISSSGGQVPLVTPPDVIESDEKHQ